jgi:beta-alanine--pyruvate transaminase
MFGLSDLAAVADVRGFGLLAGVELKPGQAPGVRGNELQAKLYDRGLHVKTTGDNAIIAPAFIASRADIDAMAEMLREAIREFS